MLANPKLATYFLNWRSRLGLLEREGNLFVRKSRLLHGHLLLGMTPTFYPISLDPNESVFGARVICWVEQPTV